MYAAPALSLRRYGSSKGSHAHEHFQVLWGWHGALELEIEGRGMRMTSGRVAVIAPGDRHDFWSRAGSACFVIDSFDASPALAALAGRVVDTDDSALHLLRFLAARHAVAEDLQGAAAAMLLSTLPQGPLRAPAGRRIDWAALDAWIDAHLAEPITVAQLASLAYLSASQFAARCLAETGLAPIAYVRERRLRHARRLRAEGWPVRRVAEHCGYRSPSALTAALHRR